MTRWPGKRTARLF